MMRLLTAAAPVSLVLGATHLMAVPYDLAAIGVAAFLLYRLVRDLAGTGGARVAVALLLASLAPTLSASTPPAEITLSVVATLSLLWWVPLLAGIAVAGPDRIAAPPLMLLAAWWALTAAVALTAPGPWAAMATRVETAAAAALAGVAVAQLAAAAPGAAGRRSMMIATLTLTCIWQAWLVLGTGRSARVLVPMLAAALMIAATDLLTDEPRDQRDGIGGGIVIAMLVLGLVPGAHTLVAQQHAAAALHAPVAPVPGAEAPSSIAAP